MPKITNHVGKQYGLLTVESLAGVTSKGHKLWNCICKCGKNVKRTGTSMIRSKNSSCGCFSKSGSDHSNWKGIGDISGDYWYNHIIRSANGSKIGNHVRNSKTLTIDMKFGWDLFLKQDRKCALSGLTLSFPKKNNDINYTASLDRIDSTKGYIEGNVQWVHKHINIMKNKFDNTYFIQICKLISSNN